MSPPSPFCISPAPPSVKGDRPRATRAIPQFGMSRIVTTSQKLRWKVVCLLTAALVSGCAHRATITTWKPAAIDVTGNQQLAIRGFSGESGDAVVRALESRLWNNEFYSIIDQRRTHALRPVAATGDDGRATALVETLSHEDLDAACNLGIDGILLGEVIEYRCEDIPVSEPGPFSDWFPQLAPPNASKEPVGDDSSDTRGSVRREATVTLSFRLLDVNTGRIRLSKEISHSTSTLIDAQAKTIPTRAEVLNALTRRCVDEFVGLLAPHQTVEPVKLAEPALFQAGYSLVHNGNEFAIRGRWDEAIATWEKALEVNPDNDAALFNLSIAHAHHQDYSRAESYAIRAMNVRQKDQYQAGLERIRQQAAAYDQTLQQRRDLTVMTSD